MRETRETIERPAPPQKRGMFDLSDLKIDDRKRRRRGLGWLRWFAAALGIALLAFGGWVRFQNRPVVVAVAVLECVRR